MEKNIAAEMHLATVKTQAAIIASLTARLSVIATMAENGEHGIAALAREAAPALPESAAVPEGWKLVPLTPTDDMRDAPEVYVGGCYSCSAQQVSWGECAKIYEAMIAAAPAA